MPRSFPLRLVLGSLLLVSPAAIAQQQESLGEQAIRGLLGGQAGNQEQQQIRQMLEERGYTDVGEIQRLYRTTARRDGRQVAVTVDPQTGQVLADRGDARRSLAGDRGGARRALRDENDVRDLLNDQGYSRVTNIQRQGRDIYANAERDGQQVSVVIDQQTGWIEEMD